LILKRSRQEVEGSGRDLDAPGGTVSQSSPITILARGPLNGADELSIELAESPDLPPVIRLRWPSKPTLCPPAQLDTTVAAAMRVLSNAVVELAAIRVYRKL
jgi:hypothetical protein